MPRKKPNSPLNLEKSIKQLETLVEQLEHGDLSLEESLKQFEKGIKLARECQQILKEAEQKITVLTKQNNNWVETDAHQFDESTNHS